MRSIYFDYNATTPLDLRVREAMQPFLGEVYANPSSIHHLGRRARAFLDEAHEGLAQVWGCKPSEVVFTGGGTESVNLAILGVARALKAKGRHIIASRTEHYSVLRACEYLANNEGFALTLLPVDSHGIIGLDLLRQALRSDTILVSIMAANNETGVLQPLGEISKLCQAAGIPFHTDAVQWFGKEDFTGIQQFGADLVSVCAHKFHGPKGSGALFVRSPLKIVPTGFGGSQEHELRPGTENLAAIEGLVEASKLFVRQPVFDKVSLKSLGRRLIETLQSLKGLGVKVWSGGMAGLSNTVSFSVADCDSLTLLAALDLEGICASSGSACSAGSLQPSHVILAMGGTRAEASSLIRFSLGRDTTADEVEYVQSVLPDLIRRAQVR